MSERQYLGIAQIVDDPSHDLLVRLLQSQVTFGAVKNCDGRKLRIIYTTKEIDKPGTRIVTVVNWLIKDTTIEQSDMQVRVDKYLELDDDTRYEILANIMRYERKFDSDGKALPMQRELVFVVAPPLPEHELLTMIEGHPLADGP